MVGHKWGKILIKNLHNIPQIRCINITIIIQRYYIHNTGCKEIHQDPCITHIRQLLPYLDDHIMHNQYRLEAQPCY